MTTFQPERTTVSAVYMDPQTSRKRNPDWCFNTRDGDTITVHRYGDRDEAERQMMERRASR